MNNHCVVTTINKPTQAIEKLYEKFGGNLIVIGDNKTPEDWSYHGTKFIPIKEQKGGEFVTRFYVPDNHYARKNLGYLHAIKNKATLIYDTDDDNVPNENWKVREIKSEAVGTYTYGWFNVYSCLTDDKVWPRGYSLKGLRPSSLLYCLKGVRESSIQQGLADGDADVDAIWRLVFDSKQIEFKMDLSISLQPKSWCPFNSQTTWWFPKAYALMYLPIYATFRMTDIWRSFVAQRCLWELGEGVTFHSPSEVFQDRNPHDLLKDFKDEVPGYLKNDLIVDVLGKLELKQGEAFVCENLLTCYYALTNEGILPENEVSSVKAWIKDYESITTGTIQ